MSKRVDGMVRLRVSDEGFGVPKEALPHLFDRFYRADFSRTKADTPGHGLGLAIAKQIVTRHKGTISVQSVEGQGSTFIIELPAKSIA